MSSSISPEDAASSSLMFPWNKYMLNLYISGKAPAPLGTVDFAEIEQNAREKLAKYPGAFLYVYGSAGTSSTNHANRKAFEKYGIVPRMLVDATTRSLETTLFGKKYSSPILIAPIGVQGIFTEEAEIATARAGKNLGVPFIMSTASSRSIEDVAEANGDGDRWFQLYWPKHDDVTLSLLRRAKENGFSALVITLDTMTLGWRPQDLATSYLPFGHGVGIEVGRSDPVFMAKHGKEPVQHYRTTFPYDPAEFVARAMSGDEAAKEDLFLGRAWLAEANSGTYRKWENLKFLRDNWDGPLILKGIQSVMDAEKALQFGVDGIIVSNHGGRQVDGAISSLLALATIMQSPLVKEAQQAGKLTVLFDSGIRTGSDIFKAIALGAQAVLMGRPWVYGGIIAGQAGIEQVLQHTVADLDSTLGLAGWASLSDLRGRATEALMKVET